MILPPDGGTIWITGASSGIGRALAIELAAPQSTLILSGRSETRLEATANACRAAGATVEILAFELGDAAARRTALERIGDRRIDMLINNAGLSQRARAVETDVSVDRTIMEVDYLSGVELTKAILPGMVERGFGRIVAVSSIAGLAGTPLRTGYGAAKAAQIVFYQSLHNELVGTGVTAHVVIAGFVRTDVSRNALTGNGSAYDRMDDNQAAGVDADRAAQEIVRGLRRGRVRIYAGMTAKGRLFVLFQRAVPRILDVILQRSDAT